MIYIVSPKGEVVYNKSGAPMGKGLNQVLTKGLADAGAEPVDPLDPVKPPADVSDKEVFAAIRLANQLLSRKQTEKAVAAIAPFFNLVEDKPTTPTSKAITGITKRLTKTGQSELDAAKKKLVTKGQAFFGLLALIKSNRIYGELPALRPEFEKELATFRDDPDKAKIVAQAELIDRGREQEDGGNRTAAIAAYREVVEKHPGTFAAKLCSAKLNQLSGG